MAARVQGRNRGWDHPDKCLERQLTCVPPDQADPKESTHALIRLLCAVAFSQLGGGVSETFIGINAGIWHAEHLGALGDSTTILAQYAQSAQKAQIAQTAQFICGAPAHVETCRALKLACRLP
jgi:hypothetical protein